MKVFLESVFGWHCFLLWMKVFLDEFFFFFCNLDESVLTAIIALGDVDMIEKENLERRAPSVELPVSAQITHPWRAYRAGEETVGCRRGQWSRLSRIRSVFCFCHERVTSQPAQMGFSLGLQRGSRLRWLVITNTCPSEVGGGGPCSFWLVRDMVSLSISVFPPKKEVATAGNASVSRKSADRTSAGSADAPANNDRCRQSSTNSDHPNCPAETNFGQTDLGQTNFGQKNLTDFGQTNFDQL